MWIAPVGHRMSSLVHLNRRRIRYNNEGAFLCRRIPAVSHGKRHSALRSSLEVDSPGVGGEERFVIQQLDEGFAFLRLRCD